MFINFKTMMYLYFLLNGKEKQDMFEIVILESEVSKNMW